MDDWPIILKEAAYPMNVFGTDSHWNNNQSRNVELDRTSLQEHPKSEK